MIVSGKLNEGQTDVTPTVSGVGQEGPIQLKVSRRHKSAPTPPNPDLQKIWAYLAVQVTLLDLAKETLRDDLFSQMRVV